MDETLKDIPAASRDVIASELVIVASADGELHSEEVRKLELIFKRLGLEQGRLYEQLHAGTSAARVDGRELNGPEQIAVSKPPFSSATRIDLSRLHSIRSETRVTSNVLADIFADDDDGLSASDTPPQSTPLHHSELYEGLEQRYGSLLSELRLRQSWSAADFDHLVKDAGLMPGAAREAINDWSLDRFDELAIEGDDPVDINIHLLPVPPPSNLAVSNEGMPA